MGLPSVLRGLATAIVAAIVAGCGASGVADVAIIVGGGQICTYSELLEDIEADCVVGSPVALVEFDLENIGVTGLQLGEVFFPGEQDDRFEEVDLPGPTRLGTGEAAPFSALCARSTCSMDIAVEITHDVPGTTDLFQFSVHAQDRL